MRYRILISFAILSLFASCKEERRIPTYPVEANPAQTAGSIYPLGIGYIWFYREAGTGIMDSCFVKDTVSVAGDIVHVFVGNDNFYFNCDLGSSGLFYRGLDLWGRKKSLVAAIVTTARRSGEFTILPDGSRLDIVSMNVLVRVPAGEFTADILYWHSRQMTIWISAKTGIVKTQSATATYELVERRTR